MYDVVQVLANLSTMPRALPHLALCPLLVLRSQRESMRKFPPSPSWRRPFSDMWNLG